MGYIYDSVNPLGIPAGVEVVAGYVDGDYANIAGLRAAHPQAYILEITVTGRKGVRVVDCERGDLSPREAAQWAFVELRAGRRPTIYCSESNWAAVIECLKAMRVHQEAIDWWIASWTTVNRAPGPVPNIFPGAQARQYASDVPHNGSSFDLSVTEGRWPLIEHPAPVESRLGVVRTDRPITASEARIKCPHGCC